MAHTTSAVELLHVVPSDQSAFRVAHEIDALAPMLASEPFDPVGQDPSELLYRPYVEAAEEPPEIDVMSAVSQPTESTRQPADGARCGEEAMHQKYRSLPAVRR
jgi:hypothetical protein